MRDPGARAGHLWARNRPCAQGGGGDQEAADGDDRRGDQGAATTAAAAQEDRDPEDPAATAALRSSAGHSDADDVLGARDRRDHAHTPARTSGDRAAGASAATA